MKIMLILLTLNSSAQQQPQWLFPLYFEDANGEKDTVYIGYDSTANMAPIYIDTIFNEGWIWIDTTKFNVYIWSYPYYSSSVSQINTDSVRKTDISSHGYPHARIGFVKGTMPITIKWEDSLLYSDKLPFPDLSPRPRARADVYCSGVHPCPVGYNPLSLTDYPAIEIKLPVFDSLFFEEFGYIEPRLAIGSLDMIIVPHNLEIVGVNEPIIKSYEIYPNPFTEHFFISRTSEIISYKILDVFGKICFENQYPNIDRIELIDLSKSSSGIYFLYINSRASNTIVKLIKL